MGKNLGVQEFNKNLGVQDFNKMMKSRSFAILKRDYEIQFTF